MKYQIVIAGFGGQGIVFLVKLLASCSLKKGLKFLGTENHGMSQRGGTIVSDLKIGDFYTPIVSLNQADLLIGLHADEVLRVLQLLKKDGSIVVNADNSFPKLDYQTYKIDAYQLFASGQVNIQSLNVLMLGQALKNVEAFVFSKQDLIDSLAEINPTFADQNIKILEMGMAAN